MIDRYTKAVVTVIAVCLCLITAQNFNFISTAEAIDRKQVSICDVVGNCAMVDQDGYLMVREKKQLTQSFPISLSVFATRKRLKNDRLAQKTFRVLEIETRCQRLWYDLDCFRRGYTFWSDSLSLWNSCLRRKRQTMIETIVVYLAGGALAIALFFVLVARIVRLITGKDLLNKKFPFIRDITNKMFLIGLTFAVVYVIVMAFIQQT